MKEAAPEIIPGGGGKILKTKKIFTAAAGRGML